MFVDLKGAYDLHVHTYPCLFPRICDDLTMARAAAQAGLNGVVLKCHHESTVSRARLISQEVEGIDTFGGIVLNYFTGGINVEAVEASLNLGGKVVWMPTIDAHYHAKIFGRRGTYGFQNSNHSKRKSDKKGISIVDDKNGKLLKCVIEILELVAEKDAILGTCHLSPAEIYLLVQEAKVHGVNKVLITHPFFKVPDLSIKQLKELVELGAMAEFGYCTVSPVCQYASIDKVFRAIQELSPARCIIISDGGQTQNPMPHEGFRIFAQFLFEKGLSREDMRKLVVDNPEFLLGIKK